MAEDQEIYSTTEGLLCLLHKDQQVEFLNTNPQREYQQSRLLCQKCYVKGSLTLEQGFEQYEELKYNMKQKLDSVIQLSRSKLNPLQQSLLNFKSDIDSTINVINEIIDDFENKLVGDNKKYMIDFENQCTRSDLQLIGEVLSLKEQPDIIPEKYFKPIIVSLKSIFQQSKKHSDLIKEKLKVFCDDLTQYKKEQEFNHPSACNAIAFNFDSSILATGFGQIIKLYNYNKNKKILEQCDTLKGHTQTVWCLAFSKDKNLLASGGQDNNLIVWEENVKKKKFNLKQILKHSDYIRSIIIREDNQILASCESQIFVWKIFDSVWLQDQVLDEHTNQVYQLSFNEKCDQMVSCGYDKKIMIWKEKDDKWLRFDKISIKNQCYKVCFITDDLIAYQESGSRYLQFFQKINGKFVDEKQLRQEFYLLNTDLDFFFPIVFNFKRQLLVLKHNSRIYFLRRRKDNQFYIEQTIEEEAFGGISDDARNLVLWNKKNQILSFYRSNHQDQQTKGETPIPVEVKFSTKKVNPILIEEKNNQQEIMKNQNEIKDSSQKPSKQSSTKSDLQQYQVVQDEMAYKQVNLEEEADIIQFE